MSTAATKDTERRQEERVSAALRVEMEATTGVTRDVSASGIFFETNATCAVGNEIALAVELDTPGGRMILRCKGEVVRIEPRDGRVGVAVRILESTIEPAA